ncbi:hypothetical protein GCM10010381_65130 [Streptomyces xantholiticus]|nr:hypothetical protein GCM10010381_65130 [Streptomyces xantholiticus]
MLEIRDGSVAGDEGMQPSRQTEWVSGFALNGPGLDIARVVAQGETTGWSLPRLALDCSGSTAAVQGEPEAPARAVLKRRE